MDSPNRQERRRAGKSDPLDAVEAARAALSGRAKSLARTRNGSVESIGVLRVARSSARKERVRALNQLSSLISTASEELRAELRGLSIFRLVNKAVGLRPNDRTDVVNATKLALRSLARRVRSTDAELAEVDAVLGPLVAATAPDLITLNGVGAETPERTTGPVTKADTAHLPALPDDVLVGHVDRHDGELAPRSMMAPSPSTMLASQALSAPV